ncbi:bifunctional DNA primase/polymerase [Mycobacterium cookii]|uniref:bifunctional DNA primase/polymerase n=1 Tax=Mycobacterium cookii TaxID=1775 RepID=UPI0013CFD9FF|nr:bifunctional DNA primase/polymerase [Mycobacterium cookii]MCV7332962.1 bifunctional DNA primase/polymerase [Mycobacterium cookii]
MEADNFVSRALKNLEHGYGCVPTGRVDPNRADLPPHKIAWCRGYHGYGARNATSAEIKAMPRRIIRRMALGGERGILNIGARLPQGVVGIDTDAHNGKRGAVTIGEHSDRLGPLPPTVVLTARGCESRSGIGFYATPPDWRGAGSLKTPSGGYGDVDLIQPHLRYVVAPGGLHHTGMPYQVYGPDGDEISSGKLPSREALPELPAEWLAALYRRPRRKGARPDVEDITTVASEWTFDEHPGALARTVDDVRNAKYGGQTRPAFHRALWIAAHKARAGCYPFSRAVAEIEAAAAAAYAERGLELDLDDFARSICHAVGEALDMSEDDLLAWGPQDGAADADARTHGAGRKLRGRR